MSTVTVAPHEHPAGRHDRLLFHLAWALAAAIFLSVGWMAMASLDPHGPVSVLAHGRGGGEEGAARVPFLRKP